MVLGFLLYSKADFVILVMLQASIFQVYIIAIVVVSVHAYNLGVVKYDYKILVTVARILYLEVKKLFEPKDGKETNDSKVCKS